MSITGSLMIALQGLYDFGRRSYIQGATPTFQHAINEHLVSALFVPHMYNGSLHPYPATPPRSKGLDVTSTHFLTPIIPAPVGGVSRPADFPREIRAEGSNDMAFNGLRNRNFDNPFDNHTVCILYLRGCPLTHPRDVSHKTARLCHGIKDFC